ncbi:MAG: sulfotransferase [Acidimicrobiia bacterium]|nr:sulfotransferase [Acidimicrobiia bacterium]
MDADALVAHACDSAGLDDFGSHSYRDGLDRLVHALDAEAELTELGVLALEAQITTNLVNRLRVTDWCATNAEARSRPVERPIVVLGLPRTGTTLLSELLHCDTANRSLMRWEAQDCVPPPRAAEFATDPRVEAARESQAAMDALNPGFKAIHYEAPDGPTECVAVLAQDFKSLLWAVVAHVPSYAEWLLECDQTSAYEYHRDVLTLLQSEAPGRWALKTPHHSLALDALVGQYPDARLVMTHRDPVTVVASLCSLARALAGTFSDGDHGAAANRLWTDIAAAIVGRVMRWRDLNGDAGFVDIGYDALVADPVGTVRATYEHFGEALSPTAEAAMQRYVADHPRGEHGRHGYDVDALGLDRVGLTERFSAYRERFDLGPEGRD